MRHHESKKHLSFIEHVFTTFYSSYDVTHVQKESHEIKECMQLVIGRVDEIKCIQVMGGYGGQEWAAKPL